MSKILLYM